MSTRYRTKLASLSKFLPETQAIIDRAILEGFTLPSSATLAYINTLIYAMKADGYWVKRDLIFNFAYNDLACLNFSRINWKNPTGNLATFGVGHNYLLEGSQGGGIATSFVNTNFNTVLHGINYTLNNASREAIIYTQSGNIIDGVNNLTEVLRNINISQQRINQGNTNTPISVDLAGTGYKAINRTSSTNLEIFNKDVQISTTANSTILQNTNLLIHRGLFLNGTNTIPYYSVGASVVTEGQLLRTAYNNYLTNIGLSTFA